MGHLMASALNPNTPTIEEFMKAAEREGKAAWLAGFSPDENPHYASDGLGHMFWELGWMLADTKYKVTNEASRTASKSTSAPPAFTPTASPAT